MVATVTLPPGIELHIFGYQDSWAFFSQISHYTKASTFRISIPLIPCPDSCAEG